MPPPLSLFVAVLPFVHFVAPAPVTPELWRMFGAKKGRRRKDILQQRQWQRWRRRLRLPTASRGVGEGGGLFFPPFPPPSALVSPFLSLSLSLTHTSIHPHTDKAPSSFFSCLAIRPSTYARSPLCSPLPPSPRSPLSSSSSRVLMVAAVVVACGSCLQAHTTRGFSMF